MKQQLKIEKKIASEIAGILRFGEYLPKGKRNALHNKCSKILQVAKKAQAIANNNRQLT